jgi:hypothetical protein
MLPPCHLGCTLMLFFYTVPSDGIPFHLPCSSVPKAVIHPQVSRKSFFLCQCLLSLVNHLVFLELINFPCNRIYHVLL